ncbi:MAG: FAD-dependent oxidoreductase, partial [Anaerolineales bacterium]|nr:FAD-dependent oxidoreductase [Anaerolineales bacterium]
MTNLPPHASVVVIGGGIVGNSLVYHLALHGWKNVVQLDKGPFPNPGGSTGHASNFIFPVDHSKEMTLVTADSVRQFKELGVFTECGGVEVARTEARMEELRRRMASAKAWGIESRLVTPAEIKQLVPYINTDILLGGFYTPSVGVVDSLRAGTLMRQKAVQMGSLTISPATEVTGLDVANGRIHTVHTNRGSLTADVVLIACGVWSPRIAHMAGATIPLTPAVHQMISVGPIPLFEQTSSEIEYPIVRDMDTFMYERQNGNDMEVGSYAHRPILMRPDDIPSIEESALSPTELPFTEEDFDPQLEQALELMPDIVGNEKAGIRHAINGLLSLTPDGAPIIGETEVKGLWSVAAIWIKEGPGFAKAAVELLTHGVSEIDIHATDAARFYDYARSETHVNARTSEAFNKTYGIVHPREQWASNRNVRVSPFYFREKEL